MLESIIYPLCFGMLALSLVLTALRFFRGPTAADRVLAADLLSIIVGAAILIYAISSEQAVFLDVVMVLGVFVFFGTVAMARAISKNPNA
ncbi:MAG: K+/H+ antiporter subunit F [Verrucomicrobia bacterium]|nr:MAG: K+/H+ antiporter subunit F [Verrucomicrobiota bacterium]